MSRLGKKAVEVPKEVTLVIEKGEIKVSGPKGSLTLSIPRGIAVELEKSEIKVTALKKNKKTKAIHGTIRALIANMIKGVTDGWSKTLELVGTGYRAEVSGKKLTLTVGYSHPVIIEAPEGIDLTVQKTSVMVEGIDKALVGHIADKIRSIRPPEPYKGKGIKYSDEVIRRKAGKAAKTQGAAA